MLDGMGNPLYVAMEMNYTTWYTTYVHINNTQVSIIIVYVQII